jgi:hypothetical protein
MSEKLYLSGLPFMLQGWNNEYTKHETNNTYHLAPYTLYYLFPILGTTISKIDGRWELTRDCDRDHFMGPTHMDIYKVGNDQEKPFGNWTYGVKVKKL